MEGILVMAGIILCQGGYPDAQMALARAYYSHSQGEAYVNERLQTIDRALPEELKQRVGTIGYIAKTILDQRVSVGWNFP
jgi:hypothetical protein